MYAFKIWDYLFIYLLLIWFLVCIFIFYILRGTLTVWFVLNLGEFVAIYRVRHQILHIFMYMNQSCRIILERKYCIGFASTSNDRMVFLSVSWTPWWLFYSCLGWLPWLCWEHSIETLLDTTKWITLWVGLSISKLFLYYQLIFSLRF